MSLKSVLFLAIIIFYETNGALLFWSKRKIQVSPLKPFTDENLVELSEELGHTETAIYKTDHILPGFEEILDGYYKAYTPNGKLNTENATYISGEDDLNLLKLKQQMQSSKSNVLSVIVLPSRHKRESPAAETSTTSIIATSTPSDLPPMSYEPPTGPVVYKGQSKKDETWGILYSSNPLLLQIGSNNYLLGRTSRDMITIDQRDPYRLIVNIPNIPVNDEMTKVAIRFNFNRYSTGYWSLKFVQIEIIGNNSQYDLAIERDVTAPRGFSYHCSGTTVFSGNETKVKLVVYDLQVQIDSRAAKFGDAYDCVPFSTGVIWSGLFVTAIFGIGLIIALIAISEIKTMDKFDNAKTKQLAITVSE